MENCNKIKIQQRTIENPFHLPITCRNPASSDMSTCSTEYLQAGTAPVQSEIDINQMWQTSDSPFVPSIHRSSSVTSNLAGSHGDGSALPNSFPSQHSRRNVSCRYWTLHHHSLDDGWRLGWRKPFTFPKPSYMLYMQQSLAEAKEQIDLISDGRSAGEWEVKPFLNGV